MRILHSWQRGFQNKRGCEDNIVDLLYIIELMQQSEALNRRNKVPNKLRQKNFIIFIDFKKAFDKIDRSTLLKKLLLYGFNKDLCAIVAQRLTNTTGLFDDEEVPFDIGVP